MTRLRRWTRKGKTRVLVPDGLSHGEDYPRPHEGEYPSQGKEEAESEESNDARENHPPPRGHSVRG